MTNPQNLDPSTCDCEHEASGISRRGVLKGLGVGALAAGAMTVSHANDSYFWVVTNFGGMTADQGYKTQTVVTLIMGVVSIVFIWILSLVLV